jgi:hypothetical protein
LIYNGLTFDNRHPAIGTWPPDLSAINSTIHPDNVFSRIEGVIVVETGQNAVSYLLNHKFFVGFALFSKPEYPIWMFSHVIDILPGVPILLAGKSDGKAGFYFMCIHSN